MYDRKLSTKTNNTTDSTGRTGGGSAGRVSDSGTKSVPIRSCPHSIQSSSGSCPRC